MIPEIELQMYFRHFRSSNSLPAEYPAISKLYPYSSGYAVTGLRRIPGRFEAITPRVAT